MELHSVSWKKFVLNDIFVVKKGHRLTKDDMNGGKTPYISSIKGNNGVSFYIDEEPKHSGNVITVNYDGSTGYAFYQPTSFWASDAVNVLYPRNWTLTPAIALFICTVITNERYRFSYGRKWKMERMMKSEIYLPVDEDDNPNWDFMEQYIISSKLGSVLKKTMGN